MDEELLLLIENIEKQSIETIYPSLLNLFYNVRFPFPIHDMRASPKPFFRVRAHNKNEEFFYNESDLTFRKDILNIKSFGRCNEPLQTMFYCSDNNVLSFCEVSSLVRKMSNSPFEFHTTSIWEIKKDITVSHILEDRINNFNTLLLSITEEFFSIISNPKLVGNKLELREFLLKMAPIFRREFSKNPSAYMLSTAYSNYIFNQIIQDEGKIDGLVYPSCLGEESINNIGLNYVFLPHIVGFGKRIELTHAYRSKMELIGEQYYEREIIDCKKINHETGEIFW